MKKKILIVGNFSFGKESFNGQTSKTRDYYHYIKYRYGEENVIPLDTANWRKRPVSSYIKLISYLKKCNKVILMLGANAATYIVPIVCKLKKMLNYSIYWSLVGGSILYDLKKQKKLVKYFKSIDALYFETKMMLNHFTDLGYKNLYYAPIFSSRKLNHPFSPKKNDNILHFCTYARVCKEKGISEAIEAVKEINKDGVKCMLDIFGTPYEDYAEEFNSRLKGAEDYIINLPYLSGNEVIDTLSQYDLMLFPTYYSGEGFPIGVIECMMGGVPVIGSNWHYNSEIIEDGVTGYIYELNQPNELVNCIKRVLSDREKLLELKINAYNYSFNFTPEKVLSHLFELLDEAEDNDEKNSYNRG